MPIPILNVRNCVLYKLFTSSFEGKILFEAKQGFVSLHLALKLDQ